MPEDDSRPADASGGPKFAKLASPVQIGSMTVRNRIAMPAMATGFASPEGFLTERCISYYLERARGGAGLIIVEPAAVTPEGRHTAETPLLDHDKFIPMHAKLCEVLHAEAVRILLQLMHAGRKTSRRLTGRVPVAPSPESDPDFGEIPEELTEKRIEEIIEAFVSAAGRAAAAGYDGVEILASGGFLLHQFLSAQSNRRHDMWGGGFIGRSRLLAEILSRIAANQPALAVSVRIGPGQKGHDDLPLEELVATARMAAERGAACINVALGAELLPRTDQVPIASPGQVKRPVEPEVRSVVSVPVIGGGSVFDLVEAERLLVDKRVDLVALGRPLITDAQLPAKVFRGRVAAVRPCIRCNVCLGRLNNPVMMCPANPMVGREQMFWLARRGAGHHVVILGAGLAGLWTALAAAELGYTVEMFEPEGILGNLLAVRSRIPGQTENYALVDYLSREIQTLGVKVHLRRRPSVRDILDHRPDAVFVTRIGEIHEPDIKGLGNVQTLDPVTVLSSDPSMGEKVVILGGGLMGAEIAYYLVKRGKHVILLEERTRVASDTHPELRQKIIAALREMNCPVHVGVHDLQVNVYGELTAQHERRTLRLPVDTVILAGNYDRCDNTWNDLGGKVKEVHFIGDAYETAELTGLVYDATRALIDMADRL